MENNVNNANQSEDVVEVLKAIIEEQPIDKKPEITEKTEEEAKNAAKEETPSNKKKSISVLTVIFAVVAIVLAILLYMFNFTGKTYKLNDFAPCFEGTEASLKLPAGYLFSDSGEIFRNNNGYLETIAGFTAESVSEEDFLAAKQDFIEYYGASEQDINGVPALRVDQFDDYGMQYTYLFLFKNDYLANLVFINCSEEEINTIASGINF